jgi:hypothetical protein
LPACKSRVEAVDLQASRGELIDGGRGDLRVVVADAVPAEVLCEQQAAGSAARARDAAVTGTQLAVSAHVASGRRGAGERGATHIHEDEDEVGLGRRSSGSLGERAGRQRAAQRRPRRHRQVDELRRLRRPPDRPQVIP